MAVNLYKRSVLIGGAADSLDVIDGAGLNDGDFALVMTSSNICYVYILNATSGAAESSPNVISPDTNAGTKRWLLQDTAATTGIFTDLTDGYVPYHVNDTSGLQNSNIYTDATKVLIGDTVDTNVTQGLTINQGANDDQIVSLKSSDVAHTVTTDTETDTYGLLKKYSATAGGLLIRGLTDVTSDGGLVLEGIIGATDPTDTHSSLILIGSKQTGTTTAALGDAETVMVFKNRTTNMFTFLGNGSVILGTSTAVGTSGAKVILIDSGTAPTTSPADAAQLWVADQNSVAGRARLHTRTEDGVSSPLALQTEVDVLHRDPDQGVAMTAAASGSSGITVADDDDIDFGTGNFALVWKGSLPDWTAGANLFYKLQGSSPFTGYQFYADASYLKFNYYQNDGGSLSISTITQAFVANTAHEIVAVITNKVGAVNGAVVFYCDGVLFGTSIPITTSYTSIDNTAALEVFGTYAVRYAGTVIHAYTLNFAPTAAEVLDMYRNGIPESWKWGSQTSLVDAAASVFTSGTYSWVAYGSNTIANVGNALEITYVDDENGAYTTFSNAADLTTDLVVGKKYRVKFDAKYAGGSAGSTIQILGANIATLTTSLVTYSYEFVATNATTNSFRCGNMSAGNVVTIDNWYLYEIGATLLLGPPSWQQDKPYDLSSNNLTVSYPTTGWTLTKPPVRKIKQPTPTAKTTAATLTIAELLTGLLTGTHSAGATQAYTLPTGTLCDAWPAFGIDDYFDWILINLSAAAADTITVTAGADHTLVGEGIVQSAHASTGQLYGNSAKFRTRKTVANTFITYRIG